MSAKIDAGDLNAAMERVNLSGSIYGTVQATCRCGEDLLEGPDKMGEYAMVLLDLVDKVAEHQTVCVTLHPRRYLHGTYGHLRGETT